MEVGLRLTGVGASTDFEDRFLTPAAPPALFQLNNETGRYEVRRECLTFFRPDSFAAVKPGREFRIFCVGGSTVQGRPYSIETAFTAWLELALRAAAPDRDWEVVNCGGISYASFRLLPIVREVLRHSPDLLIICTGHNEFLEERTAHPLTFRKAPVRQVAAFVGRLRLYRLGRAAWKKRRGAHGAAVPGPDAHAAPIQAVLDSPDGMGKYRRNDDHARAVVTHFRQSVSAMVLACRAEHVPVLLVRPAANLRDCSPFKSENTPDMSPEQVDRFEELWATAAAAEPDSASIRLQSLAAAVELNPRHAAAWFRLGRCHAANGRAADAAAALVRARDEDVCPLRMTEPLRQALADVARTTRTPLLDAQHLFAEHSELGIPGNELLVDHVHPTIAGHQMIARALLDRMGDVGLVEPAEGWRERCAAPFAEHTAGLPKDYFHQGMLRLQRTQRWARGRWESGTAVKHPTEAKSR